MTYRTIFDHLKTVVNNSHNHSGLRRRLRNHKVPCIPFLSLYLTDLAEIDTGEQETNQVQEVFSIDEAHSFINFDKHRKTAKIIGSLQSFQVPYHLAQIPELQTWIQDQLVKVHGTDQSNTVEVYHRRSLLLEPREQMQ